MEKFPGLVELQHKYGDQVACVSLSFDVYEGSKPEKHKDDVLKFLVGQKATFDNILSSTPDEQLYAKLGETFGVPEGIPIPIVLVFGTDGKLAKRFDSGKRFTYEKDVAPFVAELLKK